MDWITPAPAAFVVRSLLDFFERAIGAVLRHDPETHDAVAEMVGKVIAIDFVGLDASIYVLPDEQGVSLRTGSVGDPQVRIQGTPLALLQMMVARDRHRSALSGDVQIIGDLSLSQHLQSVLDRLEIDWEELLAGFIGDIAAHQIGNLSRWFLNWGRQTQEILEQDLAEYMHSEAQMLPEQAHVDEFVEAVDVLRADADRLEQRLQRLSRHLRQVPPKLS